MLEQNSSALLCKSSGVAIAPSPFQKCFFIFKQKRRALSTDAAIVPFIHKEKKYENAQTLLCRHAIAPETVTGIPYILNGKMKNIHKRHA